MVHRETILNRLRGWSPSLLVEKWNLSTKNWLFYNIAPLAFQTWKFEFNRKEFMVFYLEEEKECASRFRIDTVQFMVNHRGKCRRSAIYTERSTAVEPRIRFETKAESTKPIFKYYFDERILIYKFRCFFPSIFFFFRLLLTSNFHTMPGHPWLWLSSHRSPFIKSKTMKKMWLFVCKHLLNIN